MNQLDISHNVNLFFTSAIHESARYLAQCQKK